MSTLGNVCAVQWKMFSIVGDIVCTVEDQYYWGCSVLWIIVSSMGGGTVKGCYQNCGAIPSLLWRGNQKHCAISTQNACGFALQYWISSQVLMGSFSLVTIPDKEEECWEWKLTLVWNPLYWGSGIRGCWIVLQPCPNPKWWKSLKTCLALYPNPILKFLNYEINRIWFC